MGDSEDDAAMYAGLAEEADASFRRADAEEAGDQMEVLRVMAEWSEDDVVHRVSKWAVKRIDELEVEVKRMGGLLRQADRDVMCLKAGVDDE